MRSDVHQGIALCTHGTEFLSQGKGDAPELLASNTNFSMLNDLVFSRAGYGKKAATIVAEGVAPWLRRLAAEGVASLRFLSPIQPTSIRPQEGEEWGCISDGDHGFELWTPRWSRRIAGFDDPRPYRVIYTAVRLDRFNLASAPTVEDSDRVINAAVINLLTRLNDVQPALGDAVARIIRLDTSFAGLLPEVAPENATRAIKDALRIERLMDITLARTGIETLGMDAILNHAVAVGFEAAVHEVTRELTGHRLCS